MPFFRTLTRTLLLPLLLLLAGPAMAQVVNGGFEDAYTAPTINGWTKTKWKNSSGLIVPTSGPFTGASIQRASLGTGNDLTNVVTGGTDTNTVASHLLSRVRFGNQAVVVNYMGSSNNANTLIQTVTLDSSFLDPSDSKYHIRFAYAPVLQSGGHAAKDQPFFYVGVTDSTTNGVLYDSVNYSAQSGITWYTTGTIYWTEWQLVDVVLDASALGHGIKLEFTAAGCDQGGHYGHLYVDGVSPTVDDLWIAGTGPASVVKGNDITYTYTVKNNSPSTTRNNVTVSLKPPSDNQGTPVATTFVSTTLSGFSNSGGVISANLNNLAPGATTTFTMTVAVPSTAAGKIIHGDFYVSADSYPSLAGPAIDTVISGPNTDLGTTITTTAGPNCDQVSYLVTTTNTGPNVATAAQSIFTLPVGSTFVSATGPVGVGITGSGPVQALFYDMASATSKTYTVVVSMPGGTTSGTAVDATATASGVFNNTNTASGIGSGSFAWPTALSLDTSPAGGSYYNGTSAPQTVVASGGFGTKTYQWYSGTAGVTTNPVGTNSSTYAVPTGTNGTYNYWVRVLDFCGHQDSSVATVTVYSTHTITASAGTNGSITPSGSVNVTHNASQAFTIAPNTGYHVADVQVDGSSVGALTAYTFSAVTTTHTIAASFTINSYTLSYSAGANGTLTGTATQTVNHGASGTTVTAVPNTGYHFSSWSDGILTAARTDAAVSGAITVTANFTINSYTLSYAAGTNGTLTGTATQTVNHGASGTTVTAVPNTGYHFSSWSDGVLTATRTDASVSGAITVTANFTINRYTILSTLSGSGRVSPAGTQTYTDGQSAAYSFIPDPGQRVGNVLIDGVPLGSTLAYTFPALTANHNVSVVFINMGLFTVIGTPSASGSVAPSQAFVNSGDCVRIYATPDRGFHVTDLIVNGVSVGALTEYQISSVHSDITVSALFAEDAPTSSEPVVGTGTSGPASQ